MNWKDKLIPGFIGQAMRETGASELSNVGTESDEMDKSLDKNIKPDAPKTDGNTVSDADWHCATGTYESIGLDDFGSNPTAKVISGRNALELESNLNEFLESRKDIVIVKTDFVSSPGGLYYIVLYTNPIQRV
jgi:hypothetical protein